MELVLSRQEYFQRAGYVSALSEEEPELPRMQRIFYFDLETAGCAHAGTNRILRF
tara:strand:- start:330 stop:494 length:165 start_codon:yes stop_codon:yes gene_type:complete